MGEHVGESSFPQIVPIREHFMRHASRIGPATDLDTAMLTVISRTCRHLLLGYVDGYSSLALPARIKHAKSEMVPPTRRSLMPHTCHMDSHPFRSRAWIPTSAQEPVTEIDCVLLHPSPSLVLRPRPSAIDTTVVSRSSRSSRLPTEASDGFPSCTDPNFPNLTSEGFSFR